MSKTTTQYDAVIEDCTSIFSKKMQDYGTAWRVLRPTSITDQIFIKAQRIRSIQEKGTSKVAEGVIPEFIGIVNYSIMGLIQLTEGYASKEDSLSQEEVLKRYTLHFNQAKNLMSNKNHDYDEAWRDMRVSSMTDLILMKIFRTKEIENNEGKTLISEGIDANYLDIINYAVFALIKLTQE